MWRSEPATEKQKAKLAFFGCTWDEGITKGQASDALSECAKLFPDREKDYYARPATKEQLAVLRRWLAKSGETPNDYAEGEKLTYGEAKELLEEMEEERKQIDVEKFLKHG